MHTFSPTLIISICFSLHFFHLIIHLLLFFLFIFLYFRSFSIFTNVSLSPQLCFNRYILPIIHAFPLSSCFIFLTLIHTKTHFHTHIFLLYTQSFDFPLSHTLSFCLSLSILSHIYYITLYTIFQSFERTLTVLL